MKGVRVDPKNRTVRVGPGCTTGDVDHATHAFGQAVPFGIISTTGVAGLTLSGGHGYLTRQYGLAIDNLIEADVVLADGSFMTASETENADLLWALRGGGGNFGVVTSFLFRTHPAKMLYGGPIVFDLSDAAEVMRWYRDFQSNAPEDFYIFLGLQTVPAGDPFPPEHWNKQMCVLLVAHNGEDGEAAVNAIRAALPKPLIDWAGPIPYTGVADLVRRALSGRACNGTGRAISSGRCQMPPSTRISGMQAGPARVRACIFTRSTAQCIAEARATAPGTPAM